MTRCASATLPSVVELTITDALRSSIKNEVNLRLLFRTSRTSSCNDFVNPNLQPDDAAVRLVPYIASDQHAPNAYRGCHNDVDGIVVK